MGLTAIISSAASSSASAGAGVSASATSLLSPVGVGVGGIFVAAALIYLFAYLNLISASEKEMRNLHRMLVASIVPLFVAFGGIVVYRSLQIL